jgi:hypothetical protein
MVPMRTHAASPTTPRHASIATPASPASKEA